MTVAEIRLRGRTGVFVADGCRVQGGTVHVEGRWRRRLGPNNAQLRYSAPRAYSWPARDCQIRWTSGVVA